MTIYMQIQGIDGDVSTKGYSKWIQLETFDFAVTRKLNTQPGRVSDREGSRPTVSEISITKRMDKATALLFGEACAGSSKPTVKIHFLTTSGSMTPYMEYTLTDCMVSSYNVRANDLGDAANADEGHSKFPIETLTLNFKKVEMKHTQFDSKHKPAGSIPAGYDLEQASAT